MFRPPQLGHVDWGDWITLIVIIVGARKLWHLWLWYDGREVEIPEDKIVIPDEEVTTLARVAESADAGDLNSPVPKERVGSNPTLGTPTLTREEILRRVYAKKDS